MKIEKPPIIHSAGCSTNLGIIGAQCNCGSECQRDADVAYYEPLIQQMNDRVNLMQAMLNSKGVAIIDLKSLLAMAQEKLKQAKAEVFEEVCKLTEIFHIDGISVLVINSEGLQSLKSKYTEGK